MIKRCRTHQHPRQRQRPRPRRTRFGRFCRVLLFTIIVAAAACVAALFAIVPVVAKTAAYQGRLYAARVIDDAVLAELSATGNVYSSLITITRGSDGSVESIESDIVKIGKLKSRIGLRLENALDNIDRYTVNVHAGTLLGMPNFYGRGFMLPVRIIPRGYPETHIISEFSDAGVNQTIHKIILTVAVDMNTVATGIETPTKTETEYIIAETVIVGKIPNSYTHIVV